VIVDFLFWSAVGIFTLIALGLLEVAVLAVFFWLGEKARKRHDRRRLGYLRAPFRNG
jgi:hypothetical protein